MIARTPLPTELVRLAARQAGVLSNVQLRQAGVRPAAVTRRVRPWRTILPGVHLVTLDELDLPTPWEARLWAGTLAGEGHPRPSGEHCTNAKPPRSAPLIGGLSAAVLHGLADRVDGTAPSGAKGLFTFGTEHDIDVHLDARARVASGGGYRFVRHHRQRRSVEIGGLACTDVEDTVLDLCDLGTQAQAVSWVDHACQSKHTTADQLAAALAERTRAVHRRRLLQVLRGHVEGTTSPLERVYRVDVEEAHGLPRARRQHRVGSAVLDTLYEGYRLLVELDGRLGHTGTGAHRDRRRDNRHTVADQRSLRYGWHDCCSEPCEVAAEVAGVLTLNGWTGTPTTCPSCPPDVFSAWRGESA